MKTYIKFLRMFTGVSYEYAVAQWYTLRDKDKLNPIISAKESAEKINRTRK
jgi:hypothetical protein